MPASHQLELAIAIGRAGRGRRIMCEAVAAVLQMSWRMYVRGSTSITILHTMCIAAVRWDRAREMEMVSE